jgi:hypothetical protein
VLVGLIDAKGIGVANLYGCEAVGHKLKNRQKMIFFWLHSNENKQPVHMRYHLFMHYGWFLQNLGKDFI